MPTKRIPIKGEPDFNTISDERLHGFIDLVQQMIFVYKYCDTEKTRVLQEIWKQCSNEETDRLCTSAIKELDRQEAEVDTPVIRKIKPVKSIKRVKS